VGDRWTTSRWRHHHHNHAATALTCWQDARWRLFRPPGRLTPAVPVSAVRRTTRRRFAGLSAVGGGKRRCRLSNFAPDRLGVLACAAALHGNSGEFSLFQPPPAVVVAAMNTSLPVLLCRSNAVFWVICQFDKPDGSARSLGPFSIPSLGDGVMLGTAWIDRPVDTQDLHSLLPRPP
jgi:hypothetical protein